MQGVLTRMARAQHTPMHQLTPAQAREAYAKGADVLEVPRAPVHRVQDLSVPTRDGAALRARLYAHAGEGLQPVLLYLHGGGFTIGNIETHDILCREFAAHSRAAVVSLDYRLAPEHRFPTAVHDAWDSLQWLHHHAAPLGLDAQRMAVGGDSAGGTLAAVCALMARDAGLPVALQLLIYPGTMAYADTDSHRTYAEGYVLGAKEIEYFFRQYIDAKDRSDWRFAPLNADDHSGVAPAFVALAECDPLFDEGMEYADTLRRAGVDVQLEIYQGVTHEFIKMGRTIPEARQFHQDAAAALQETFQASS